MARYRRRSHYRRKKIETAWQPAQWWLNNVSVPNGTSTAPGELNVTKIFQPGTEGSDGDHFAFETPVTLERMRGWAAHTPNQASYTAWFPVNVAMMVVPAAIARGISADEIPDLQANLDGDDFFYYGSMVCGANATDNLHPIDNKAKRRFAVGDAVLAVLNAKNFVNSTLSLDFMLNFRFLWKTN